MDHTRTNQSLRTSHIALTFLCSFIATIFLLQWWQHSNYPLYIWTLLCIFCFLCILSPYKKATASILAATLGLTLALLAVSRTTHIATPDSIDSYAHGKTVTIQGTIVEAPDDRQTFINYTIAATTIQATATGTAIPVTGKVLATDKRRWPRFQYGDQVTIIGQLDRPKASDSFAYDNYLSRFDIYATQRISVISSPSTPLRTDSIFVISSGVEKSASSIKGALITLRERFEAQINAIYPEPHASFLAGLLTGSRKGMPAHLTQAFKQTGLTHIVAISGFNIGVIIAIISGSLFFLPLKRRFIPSVIAIVLFTLFVGASASVVRASIMGILGLLALQTGRLQDARLAILWTAFFMLIINPKELWYDAGFQLSFLAVIGLTETAPYIETWMKRIPNTLGIREALAMTIAAQVFATPWVVAQFGLLSVISPIANILVAPLIPPAMLFGFLGTTISFISFPIGQLTAYIGWGCMELIILIATSLATIPYASIDIPGVGTTIVSIYYILIGIGLILLHKKNAFSKI